MRPRIYVFSPVDAAADTYQHLEALGCELVIAPRPWVSPIQPTETELIAVAANTDALVGTMIYSTMARRGSRP